MGTSKYSSLSVAEYLIAKINMEIVSQLSLSRSNGGIDTYKGWLIYVRLLFWVSEAALGNISSVREVQIIPVDAKLCNKCIDLFRLLLFLLPLTLVSKAKGSIWIKGRSYFTHPLWKRKLQQKDGVGMRKAWIWWLKLHCNICLGVFSLRHKIFIWCHFRNSAVILKMAWISKV